MKEGLQIVGLPDESLLKDPSFATREKMKYAAIFQELVDPNNNLERISEHIDNGAYPIFYSNHNHHMNIDGVRMVYNALENRPKDMYFVVAWSLLNGGQDDRLVNAARGMMQILQNERTHLLPFASPYDYDKIKQKFGESVARKAGKDTITNIRFTLSTLTQDAGFCIFPGINTVEAEEKPDGTKTGMKTIEDTIFPNLIKEADKVGRELVFVPIGMVDTNKIIKRRKIWPNGRIMFAYAKDKVAEHLGIKLGDIHPVAQVVVGDPILIKPGDFNSEQLSKENNQALSDDLLARVAILLKEEDRGDFRNYEFKLEQLKPGIEVYLPS